MNQMQKNRRNAVPVVFEVLNDAQVDDEIAT